MEVNIQDPVEAEGSNITENLSDAVEKELVKQITNKLKALRKQTRDIQKRGKDSAEIEDINNIIKNKANHINSEMKDLVHKSIEKAAMKKVYVWVKGRIVKIMEQYELNYREAKKDAREVDKRLKMEDENLRSKAHSNIVFPIW